MLARVSTAALWGLEAFPVECEVDVGSGLPAFLLVGLPDASVREARERVLPALRNSGFDPPARRITVNLAPAERRKEGASLDLAVALGILAAMEQIPAEPLARTAAVGELSLDGRVRPVRGALGLAEAAAGHGRTLLCAAECAPQAALVDGLVVYPIATLQQAVHHLRVGPSGPPASPASRPSVETRDAQLDLCEVRGQSVAKRALEIAAAGSHHLLLVGPPGAGKSMLAQRLPSILPPLAPAEALAVTRLHSVAGLLPPGHGLVSKRPFRAPHHTSSTAGILGGGRPPRPGEISLAHHGVLFLDELAEFSRFLLDALRQPLESGSIALARAHGAVTYPARVLLVAAMNPCPCGWHGHPRRACRCAPGLLTHYATRISGPWLDRMDLQVEVHSLSAAELARESQDAEPSSVVAVRVREARERQAARALGPNGALGPRELQRACPLGPAARGLLKDAAEVFALSGRAVARAQRVARTIADLAGAAQVTEHHLAEALQYRAYEARRFAIGG